MKSNGRIGAGRVQSRQIKLSELTQADQDEYLKQLNMAIEGALPSGQSDIGTAFFAFIMFDDAGKLHYMSNARPQGIAKAFRELADNLEQAEKEKPPA